MDETRAPLFSAWDLLPAAVLAAVWLWLGHWTPRLPDHIPSHWNVAGQVNGWMDKRAFFGFAAFPSAGIWILLFLVGAVVRMDGSERRQLGARALLPLRGLLPAGFLAMAGGFAPMAAFCGGKAIAWGVGVLLLCLILGFVPVLRLARLAPPIDGATASDYRLGGLIYWNADDDRLMVPKRLGLGWTFNFGRPAAWGLLALMLAPIAVALVILANR